MFDRSLALTIRLAALAVMLGWLLSVLHLLNSSGYLFIGLPCVLAVVILSCQRQERRKGVSIFRRMLRWWKCRRLLPLIFLFMVLLVICGSILYRPNNYDGLSYRIPKVLYWTGQEHWCWIKTAFGPANYTMPNYEWLTVPIFLATGGFHLDVVINWISFLFLPPLFFSLLRTFGAPRRLAWDWMWIFPSGYIITMQAGGIANDLPGLTAILAALYCADRFVATNRKSYLFDALLAAGFCTGIKLCNLPLAGFVLIILLKNAGWLRTHRITFTVAATAALCVSAFIPVLLNLEHAGTILGTTTSIDDLHSPVAGLLGNFLISFVQALAPPVFPAANHISAMLQRSLGPALGSWLQSHYVKFSLRLNELPQEDYGGLGLAVTITLLVNIILGMKYDKRKSLSACKSQLLLWQKIAWAGWFIFSAAVISAKLGTGSAFCRNMLSWFPLLLAPVIAYFGCEQISRSAIWRLLTPLVSLSVVPALLLTPSRPLIPSPAIAKLAQVSGVSSATLKRLNLVYKVYADRADAFAVLKKYLPPDVKILGLVSGGGGPTASWWKPYGSRRCIYLLSEADVDAARNQGVKYVILKQISCERFFHVGVAHWLKMHHAREIKTVEIRLLAHIPPFRYTLAEFENNTH